MKKSFNYLCLLMAFLFISVLATAADYTKKFSKSWPAGEVETLSIENKFGEVKVNTTSGSLVTVDVLIKSEDSESKAKKILDAITVEFGKEGMTAIAETEFDSKTNLSGKFSVDYIVNLPASKNLTVSNKYGNTIIGDLKGRAVLDVAYGNLTATRLENASNEIELAYGSGSIQSLTSASMEMSYYKITIGSVGDLSLESKYSQLSADELTRLNLESKYDNFNIGKASVVEAESKFTQYKIGTLSKKLRIESGYGSVKVDQIPAGFELLEVYSSYATVQLGIEESAAYQVTADCEYCGIEYPEGKFKGNRTKENTKMSINGQISSGGSAKVIVSSKYGNIRLSK